MTPAKQLTLHITAPSLKQHSLSFFKPSSPLICCSASRRQVKLGAAHLASTPWSQCNPFSSPGSSAQCGSVTKYTWVPANPNGLCFCYTGKCIFLHIPTWQCIPCRAQADRQRAEENKHNVHVTFSHIVVVSQKAVVNFPCVRVLAHWQQDYSACLSAVDW